MKNHSKIFYLSLLIFIQSCGKPDQKLPVEEAKSIAKEAYIYGLPLVLNYKTLYANVVDKNSGDYKGEFNEISCEARLYTPEDKAIVTVNSDTPYCMFWSDIQEEPVIFTVPEMEDDRYYSFQLIDLYTHNFAYIGSLTTGSQAGKYLVATKDWSGNVPEGITEVLRTETPIFFTIVRTQMMDTHDLGRVQEIQNQYKMQTLREYRGESSRPKKRNMEFPVWQEGDQFTEAAFNYLDFVLKLVQPVEKEKPLMERMAKLGIGTQKGYDINRFEPEVQEAIQQGVKDAFAEMEAFIAKTNSDPLGSSKIFGTREFLEKSAQDNYGHDNIHMIRAVGAYLGIYGNSGSEATYPFYMIDKEGQPLNASAYNYTMTLQPDNLPPVKAFWSLTMYDGKSQLLVDNHINRYLVNSNMIDDFVKNPDGSITIYLQKNSPGKELEANWLPAPDGPFYSVMRLYGPEETVLTGVWTNPPIEKVKTP
ncbi:DUF1254 domain-containing protein [Pararhodonellum marinum]|uniref:DUF1254 domain-containing protein n=1 Tax=Pararhodonellum marinum TaxID=2755358 RepID=UPI00188E658C|nr:DUF1254 domain-containing protein [Pararhodonellum marinum]